MSAETARLTIVVVALSLLACDRAAEVEQAASQTTPAPAPRESPYQHPRPIFPQRPRADDAVRDPSVPPVRISGDEPKYTDAARRARVQGIVILEVIVEKDGRISSGRVLKPLPFGLSEAAVEAVRTYQYKPGSHNGRTVRTVLNEIVEFKLPR